ncbi:MAG: chemotaxis-specific protein-glutamate methyltransferase CheB [Sandaracinaceae bacterium]|nr:chemotaxis-specific protein-glutamate methyltransferase CheB [Sandaracinaceae bacterium]
MTTRVLLVDDSPSFRAGARATLALDGRLVIAGEAEDGEGAIAQVRALRPDVVLMDVQMPGIGGYEATRRIMAEAPTPVVITSSTIDPARVDATIEALGAGALAALPKPPGPSSPSFDAEWRHLWRTVVAMAQVRVVRRWHQGARAPSDADAEGRTLRRPTAIAIAASTGGPAALRNILTRLPKDLPAPVFVVQHISPGFAGGLARWLDGASPLSVLLAEDGQPIVAGRVYVAPTEAHLAIAPDGRRIHVTAADPIGGFRPSANVLFESAATAYESGTLALMLTGMGRDGVEGLRRVCEAGGHVIAQDEQSSVVFGMPGAAVGAGVVHRVAPLSQIPAIVAKSFR